MQTIKELEQSLHDAEERLLFELRQLRKNVRARGTVYKPPTELTLGQRIADKVAATMGSWSFIIIQTTILIAWVALNVTAYFRNWDPYPFILLNLALSFQAAYAAPVIMMSQNRQQDIDRKEAGHDYQINIKAELEIERLHEKIDQSLTRAISDLTALLKNQREAPDGTEA
jgi:uncharacterized membrane protein